MASTYHVICFDEFDWDYLNRSAETFIKALRERAPAVHVVAHWPSALVFDFDKKNPAVDQVVLDILNTHCDSFYVQRDNEPILL